MKNKMSNILGVCFALPFLIVLIVAGVIMLKDISIGRVMMIAGVYIMFGLPAIDTLGESISGFCGRVIVAQVISATYTRDKGWYIVYAYTNGDKIKFGTMKSRYREPGKTLLVKCWRVFRCAVLPDKNMQQEYDGNAWDDDKINEAKSMYGKHERKYWTIVGCMLVLALILIIVGAILG